MHGGFLSGLARLGVGSLDLVQVLVRALDDVELVFHGLDVLPVWLNGVVQVLVRHGGCFFLDT
ncbi:hypothetical protein SNL152K_4102 [Streptomyces sp. NL15-2K]|nr:hypothetical protein SNL152K_4102 [Streptomyces sp. NL15-2K]